MKYLSNIRVLWVVIVLPLCLLASVEDEVLVLFKSDVIQMPAGKNEANLSEIIAPQEIINCLQEIRPEKIVKALPAFNRADTLRITEDGCVG